MSNVKKGMAIVLLLGLFFPLFVQPAYADDVNIGKKNILSGLIRKKFSGLEGDPSKYNHGSLATYNIDVGSNSGDPGTFDLGGKFHRFLQDSMIAFSNLIITINQWMTSLMITILNFAYQSDVFNQLIRIFESTEQNVTGIHSLSFGSAGLFGSFIGIITLMAAIYAAYQLLWRRASLESLNSLIKTIVALAAALIFFTNYGSLLTGLNNLTTRTTGLILAGGNNLMNDENLSTSEILEEMDDNVWEQFIYRPYLFLQFGTANEDEIGIDRIKNLVYGFSLVPNIPFGDDDPRKKYVEDTEIKERGNLVMLYRNWSDRLSFSMVYWTVNIFSGIMLFFLAFLLIVFQIWFLGVALIAPFTFLLAAVPGQFGVLKKYLVELILPLGLKLVVSLVAVFVITFTGAIYNLQVEGFARYITIVILNFASLIVLFLLRHRIMNIFSAGSREIQAIRAELKNVKSQSVKPVRTAAVIGGAAAGAYIGGAQGARTGGDMAAALTNKVTGESKGPGEVKSALERGYRTKQLGDIRKTQEQDKLERRAQDQRRHALEVEKIGVDKVRAETDAERLKLAKNEEERKKEKHEAWRRRERQKYNKGQNRGQNQSSGQNQDRGQNKKSKGNDGKEN